MTVRELAMRLKEMYENSSNEKTTMIHLFGIMYAEEIKGCGSTPKEILKLANMPESYQTEISKGVRLPFHAIAACDFTISWLAILAHTWR